MSGPNIRPVVVFDGDCGLCNGFVAWLIRRDREAQFLIAGSAGEVGRAALSAMGLPQEIAASTLVVASPSGPALRSDATIAVLARLSWPWRTLGAAIRAVPRGWRNRVYDAIAARRPRRPAEDPACGTPPAGLVADWRARLATLEDVEALHARR
ncbi:thiol-disulfide oxidoreductase DCC family protein [Demequina sp. NBRC 110057]|uniref:thiol-disulfide oxidoreductase DCC family protein n=1 Tax=Demequina sp. NBRC 110057 TaxID=1570346 RepID=UPI0013565719|nr:DCC1-like thiol-disulfide oxidoreductase family protein [Demequina sp. NBRC 110057]